MPHYLSGGASPPAIRAVLERLRDLAGLAVDLDGLDDQSRRLRDRVEDGLADRPDVLEVITAIEDGEDEVDETELPERRRARVRDRALPARPELNRT